MIVKPAIAAMLASGLVVPEKPAIILPRPAIVKPESLEVSKHMLLGMPLTMGMLKPQSGISLVGIGVFNSPVQSTIVVDKPAGTTTNDIIVIGVVGGHPTTNSTFTLSGFVERMDSGAVTNCALYTKTAGASEPASYTITCTSQARFEAIIAVYRKAEVGVIGSVSANATTISVTAPMITVAANHSLLLGFFFANQNTLGISFSTPTGMSLAIRDSSTNLPAIALFVQSVNSGSTGTRQSTISIFDGARAILMSLSPTP